MCQLFTEKYQAYWLFELGDYPECIAHREGKIEFGRILVKGGSHCCRRGRSLVRMLRSHSLPHQPLD